MTIWRREHRPVLRSVVGLFDSQGSGPVAVSDIARSTGLDEAVVSRALNALDQARPELFTKLDRRISSIAGVEAPTNIARQSIGWRAPGAWPSDSRRALVISILSLVVAAIALLISLI
jgi:hypothetical protein